MTSVQSEPFTGPLTADIIKALVFHAERDPRIEVCGFIMDIPDFGITPVQCRNSHKNPEHYFEVHPDDLRMVYDSEEWLVGIYHSHPNGPAHPSSADFKYAPEGLRYFIVCDGKVTEWDTTTKEEIK